MPMRGIHKVHNKLTNHPICPNKKSPSNDELHNPKMGSMYMAINTDYFSENRDII